MIEFTRKHIGMFSREHQIGDPVWCFSGSRGHSYYKNLAVVVGDTPKKMKVMSFFRDYDLSNIKAHSSNMNSENAMYAEPWTMSTEELTEVKQIQKDIKEHNNE